MFKRILFFTTLLFHFSMYGQNSLAIDSLYSNAINDKNDSSKVKKLNDIVWEIMFNDKKQSLKIADEALAISEKTRNPVSLSDSYNTLGAYYYINSEFQKSIKFHQNALIIRKKLNDEKGLMASYNNIGSSYKEIGDFKKESENYMYALKISEKIKDSLAWSKILNNLADAFLRQDQFEKSEEYNNKALAYRESINDKKGIASSLINLATIYNKESKFAKSEEYYKRVENILKEIDDNFIKAKYYADYAALLKDLSREKEAVAYINKSIETNAKIGNNNSNLVNYINLAAICESQKEPLKANDAYKLALDLSKKIGNILWQKQAYLGLATTFQELKKYDLAYSNRLQYEMLKDSLGNIDLKIKLNELNDKYETQKNENQIKLLEQNEKINNLTIKEQHFNLQKRNYMLLASVLLLFLLLIGTYFWYSKQRLKNTIAREKAITETEEKERVRIAKDIHDDLGSGLSKINFLSEIIYKNSEQLPAIRNNIKSVSETSKNLVENMRDLIWALNPENTTLANLIARIREYSTDYLEDLSIELKSVYPEEVSQTLIYKDSHREIFMIVKECLNNIAKHSKASLVEMEVLIKDISLSISIQDNGVGFDTENYTAGNGLRNIKNRIVSISGQLNISSDLQNGTTIYILIALDKTLKS